MNPNQNEILINKNDIELKEGNLIFNPYNPNNKEITVNEVQSILTKYGVPDKVHNFKLYRRAFIHSTYVKRPELENKELGIKISNKPDNCLPLSTKSNERLEFLGDGVLELVVKYYLYRRFPKADEGFMTDTRISLIKNEHIGKIAYEMGLHKWFIISKHAEEKGIRTNVKKLGCLFEAFVGALFLDFNKVEVKDEHGWFENVFICGPGFQIVQLFIESILEKHVDWSILVSNNVNFKHQLQIIVQRKFQTIPSYVQLNRDYQNGYTMGVYLCLNQKIYETQIENAEKYEFIQSFDTILERSSQGEKLLVYFAEGSHTNKRKAEQIACEEALKLINNS